MSNPDPDLYEQIAKKIVDDLEGRSGFDGWWEDIDPPIQAEIHEEIASTIRNAMERGEVA